MDYEKEHKKLVGKIKNAYLYAQTNSTKAVLEDILPELKESKDEKIRKAIYGWIYTQPSQFFDDGFSKEEMLAWLEKQDKSKKYIFKSIPRLLDMIEPTERAKAYTKKLINTLTEEGYITDAKIVEECLKQMNGEHVAMAVMDEKRGEQILANSAKTGKDEQNTADKVGPNFHKGQWIVWQDKCYKVNYNGCGYELVDQNGLSTSLGYGTIDENAHLWDVTKDAKDGDVLVLNDEVFIYAHRKQLYDIAVAHCFVNSGGGFYFEGEFGYTERGNSIHPATKEQREQLEKAISDAGYTFDFEKKELKKIEQKSAWSEEDEKFFKTALWHISYSISNGKSTDIHCDTTDWLKSLKERYTWKPSEEQIKTCKEVYADLLSARGFNICTVNSELNRMEEELKKLKG